MNRREVLTGLGAAAGAALWPRGAAAQAGAGELSFSLLRAAWELWKSRHLEPSGRVVDGPQADASHSEGQGYGLTLASLVGDENAVLRIVSWTDANLAVRPDPLLAWRWLPGRVPSVPDTNNATDGDLFFAWGCLDAGRRFGRADLVERGRPIARAIAATCVVADPRGGGRLVLLPAVEGFRDGGSIVLNPSYNMPLFMRDLATAAGVPDLAQAADDSVVLLAELARDGTTPDWILLSPDGIGPSPAFSDRTGYEAIRVPLFLVWSDLGDHPMVDRHRRAIAAGRPRPFDVPTVFERTSGRVLERSDHIGYLALAALLECGLGRGASFGPWTGIPPYGLAQPYYPATLHMMALVSQIARYPSCVPL